MSVAASLPLCRGLPGGARGRHDGGLRRQDARQPVAEGHLGSAPAPRRPMGLGRGADKAGCAARAEVPALVYFPEFEAPDRRRPRLRREQAPPDRGLRHGDVRVAEHRERQPLPPLVLGHGPAPRLVRRLRPQEPLGADRGSAGPRPRPGHCRLDRPAGGGGRRRRPRRARAGAVPERDVSSHPAKIIRASGGEHRRPAAGLQRRGCWRWRRSTRRHGGQRRDAERRGGGGPQPGAGGAAAGDAASGAACDVECLAPVLGERPNL
mmetsp:Transcript_2347/g.6630  ORF Transcript_2347/g.6630 Transcript_2347/m.6630 type:complete len:265 (-) Transcript_2347:1403-2197(-)